MDTKTILAALIALLIGLGIGYLVWGGTNAVGQTDTGGTRGEWPMVPCPPDDPQAPMAFEVCDMITNLAMAATPQGPEAMNCAWKAQSKKSGNPPDPMRASETLQTCLERAQAGDWVACEQGLDTLPD